MTTLTTSTTATVGDATTVTQTVQITVLPAAAQGTGTGRLIHPSLGTYDYAYAPDEWVNVDGDVIIPPVWSSSKTLTGAANTLWSGTVRDVVIEERWNQQASMPMAMLRMLAAFWMNPPDPAVAHVQWYPTYANALGFNVVLLDFTVGQGVSLAGGAGVSGGIQLDFLSQQDWAQGAVSLKMRIAGRL